MGYLGTFFLHLMVLVYMKSAQTQSVVEYSIEEEQDPVVTIGNLIEDWQSSTLNQSDIVGASFNIVPLDNNNHEYFGIDDGNGDLLLLRRINRDQLCPMEEECRINLDIQVKSDTDFNLIQTSIIILDINDESPQFREASFEFSLSEASAKGMTLNLPTANDLDSPQNGIVEYSVDNLNAVFEFRYDLSQTNQEPILVLSESLDRETMALYTFNLLASDSATIPHTGSTQILIRVLDVNDNSPEFEQTTYDVIVNEDVRSGYEIIRLVATDLDEGENGEILYHLSDRTTEAYGDLFQLDEQSGRLTLNGTLDYETTTETTLFVIARNKDASSLFTQAKINIKIQDVNDNAPAIRTVGSLGQGVLLSEYTNENEFVVHVKVSDEDTENGGIFQCSLDSPNFELVKILDTDFKIMTLTKFDRETTASYTLTVVCVDEGVPALSSQQEITIIITDENDNRPLFENDEYTVNVTENEPVGDTLLTLIATDSDAGPNGSVIYRISETTSVEYSYIEIDQKTGSVTSKRVLDYEHVTLLTFKVIASDEGNPSLSSECHVTIYVLDEDDNPPVFTLPSHTVEVAENNEPGAVIGKITANDTDSYQFNAVTYELASFDGHESDFSIDSYTGTIFANFTLDREQEVNYTLLVHAKGPPPARHNATTTLFIQVLDLNDNAPVFIFPSEDNNTILMGSYLQKNAIIARIIAEDRDDGKNSLLSYHIISGDVDGILDLNQYTGYLTVNKDYTVTNVHTTELIISASDNGSPPQSATVSLYMDFNQTQVESSSFSLQSRGKNESIAILIGVLSGIVVIILLIAILCLIRLRYNTRSTKPTRLQSLSESVDANNSIQFGDSGYTGDHVQGYVNDGMECEESAHVAGHPPYMGENYSGITGPVKDSGSEGSNTDSGHGSHEETASLPGAGSLQKWDTVFLAQDPASLNEIGEHNDVMTRQHQFKETGQAPHALHTTMFERNDVTHSEDQFQPMTSHPESWLPLDEYRDNQAPLPGYHHTGQTTPYYLTLHADYVHDSYRESPDLYRDFAPSCTRTRSNVIDLRDYERDQNECFVDEELDTFDERYCDSSAARMPNHIKRRSNSFANDDYPYRERDVFPGHVAGFCTPQPKNIKYCSQV